MQLVLPVSVVEGEDNIVCERSRLTGQLLVTMKKTKPGKGEWCNDEPVEIVAPKTVRNRRLERLKAEPNAVVDYKNIIARPVKQPIARGIIDRKFVKTDIVAPQDDDFVDNPEVPPLC